MEKQEKTFDIKDLIKAVEGLKFSDSENIAYFLRRKTNRSNGKNQNQEMQNKKTISKKTHGAPKFTNHSIMGLNGKKEKASK